MPNSSALDLADSEAVMAVLQDVAARFINPRFRTLADDQIGEKRPGDYVTIADRESEQALTELLSAAAPDALIVGEEATATDRGLLDRLATAEHAFVIDPLDGTGNFVRGSVDHAVLLAELRDGHSVRGWIWQPQHEQAFIAQRGKGVWHNGRQLTSLHVAEPPTVATTRGRQLAADGLQPISTNMCCGVDYPELLLSGAGALAYRNPMPWDHAAGTLMVRELGGTVRYADGGAYIPGERVDPKRLLVVASTAQLADRIRAQ